MIVVSLSNCPPRLRGELTKWFEEIDTCVFVGNTNARVRDELWNRIVDNIGNGRAVMVFSARNEQHMDFRVHNSQWQPIDFDGIKLMLRPNVQINAKPNEGESWLSAVGGAIINRKSMSRRGEELPHTYTILDVETTGLSLLTDKLIEIGAIRVENDSITAEYNRLIRIAEPLDESIVKLTGITDELLKSEGVDEKTAVKGFIDFAQKSIIISHNLRFDYGFIRDACKRHDFPVLSNRGIDTVELARKKLYDVSDYKFSTLASYYSIECVDRHRSMSDCIILKQIYDKLIKK